VREKRHGFGWDRWSRVWFYETLGLFDDYGVWHYKAWKRCQFDRSHNPLEEVDRVSLVWEIHVLGLTRRGLETGFEYRDSFRPYLWGTGGEIPPVYPTSKDE